MGGRSSLAKTFVGRSEQPRQSAIFGVVIHTTGSGVVDKAKREGIDPLSAVIKVYSDPDNYCAHYAIGWDGTIVQIVDEALRAQHVGYPGADHRAMLDGSWETRVAPATAALWRARWPNVAGPAYLFPGTSPNSCYVGIELIPLTGDDGQPSPMSEGLTFTKKQHEATANLVSDIADRWELPINEILSSARGRLLGHEDLNALERSDAGGGWDPGALREVPRFDYDAVRSFIAHLRAGV